MNTGVRVYPVDRGRWFLLHGVEQSAEHGLATRRGEMERQEQHADVTQLYCNVKEAFLMLSVRPCPSLRVESLSHTLVDSSGRRVAS